MTECVHDVADSRENLYTPLLDALGLRPSTLDLLHLLHIVSITIFLENTPFAKLHSALRRRHEKSNSSMQFTRAHFIECNVESL